MRSRIAVVALLLALVIGGGSAIAAGLYPTTVYPTFTGDISTETTIATAAAGTNFTIHAAVAQVSTAGVVVFRDGTAGTTIANVYLTSTPTKLDTIFGASGLACTATDRKITATLSGSTLTIFLRCDQK